MRYALLLLLLLLLLLAAVGIVALGCSSVKRPGASEDARVAAPGARAPTHCPECGGALVEVATVHDDREKPSKNLALWNRSICGNPFYGPDAVVCANCWLAYLPALDRWERSSELPDSFRRPLVPAIRECPLPRPEDVKSRVVYSQEVRDDGVNESISFWCADSAEFISHLRVYAREHDLSFRVEYGGRIAHQVCVVVETKPAV